MKVDRYETDDIYIVAEMGQNHNGDLKIAKALIDDAYFAGCSAVKSAKRDLTYELSDDAYKRVYDNPNAFARTYGKHREFLELAHEDHKLLKRFCNNRNMDYFLSVCDKPSLEFALELEPPLIKIPSKEINNIPLLEAVAECDKPIVFSIGLATASEIAEAEVIFLDNDYTICVTTSMYPTYLDNVNLNRLKNFTYSKVGGSFHISDPIMGIAAAAMGATYIEYHITLDREMKGSDHICSLEVNELEYLVSSIKDLRIALGSDEIPQKLPSYLNSTKKKLTKSRGEDGVYRI